MQALTFRGPKTVEAVDVAEPSLPDPDSVLVKITSAGICGSDLHTYDGEFLATIPEVGFTLGHEAVGHIIEAGANVRSVSVGDRVLIAASAGCLHCPQCATGRVMRCTSGQLGVYGIGMGLDGLQASVAAVRHADRNVVVIADTISDDAAVLLTDNLPTGWAAARKAGVRPGSTVGVVGLGPVGMCAIMSALAMGAARVIAVDPLPDRRKLAESIGAETAFGDDVPAAVRDLTNGQNADCVIEAVGTESALQTAIQIAAVGGAVAIAGVPSVMTTEFPFMHLFAAQLSLHGVVCSVQQELPVLLPLVARGRLRPEPIVTHHFTLQQGPEAYRTFAERHPGTGKVVFTVD